ncbi:MAG: hypothetical protein Q8R86_06225 [Sulfuricurvum sp.]|nr:hypothetical protein [Sulfuricurvum sp.]
MEFVIKYMLVMIGLIAIIIIYSMARLGEENEKRKINFKKISNKKYPIKPVNKKIFIYIIGVFLIIAGYRNLKSNENTIKNTADLQNSYQNEKQIIKIGNRNAIYSVTQNDEIKKIEEIIIRGCKGKEMCEIDKTFEYVTNKPYMLSDHDRNPNEVINLDGGDCDEKSFLFASMLKERNHKCVIIFTKKHAFVAVYLKDRSNLYPHTASLEIDGKYYFYAETTAKGSHIGWFNGVEPKDFKGIYDVNEEKEIAMNEVALNLN